VFWEIPIRRLRTTASPQEQEALILAAAAEEFARVGVRRSSLALVADQAGVSRRTLYRRFPTKEDLLYAVVSDLAGSILAELAHTVSGLGVPDTVVEVFCIAVQKAKTDGILRQLTVSEPQTLGALLGFVGPDMNLILGKVIDLAVLQARRAGASMDERQLRIAVEAMIRLTTSLMNSPSAVVDLDDPAAARAYAAQILAPMIW
jgi:TetR/AcrR family transcriptional regulator